MNKQKAAELTSKAVPYLGREIRINILNDEGQVKRVANCRFINWGGISISVNGDQPNIDLYAKCTDIDDDKTYTPSLESVINEFIRLDKI